METRVFGPSMWPLVWSGAAIHLQECELDDLEPGDLVAVFTSLGPVLHRVVERDGVLCTEGDWRGVCDGPINPERLLGLVSGVVIGRWMVPSPRPVTRWVNRRVLSVLPKLRLLREPRTMASLRRGRDWVARSALGRAITGYEPIAIRVLEPADEQNLRRTAWKRGQYSVSVHAELRDLARSRGGCAIGAIHPTRGIVGQLLLREDRQDSTAIGAWDHWVDPWFRGRGIGTDLIRAAIDEAARRGHERVRVAVRDQSAASRIWTQLGAVVESVRPPAELGERAIVGLNLHLDAGFRSSAHEVG